MGARTHDAVVVGGGVVGLAAAWRLLGMGARDVVLVERERIGHHRGSSHGAARITRTAYAQAEYARLMRQVQAVEWPALEAEAGVRLVRPCDGLFFGPDQARLQTYAAALAAAGVTSSSVERLGTAEARRRFPRFRIGDGEEALHDHTAGVIAAEETVRALQRLVRARGGTILEERRVLALRPEADAVVVETSSGPLAAARVVVAAGAWARELVPWLRVRVTRQTIQYLSFPFPAEELPVWVRFDGDGASSYGLPEVGRDLVKLARHEVNVRDDDPEEGFRLQASGFRPDRGLEALAAETLNVRGGTVVEVDHCLYTATADEEFVVRVSPDDPRIVVGSACSGHGFKFAPLTGRALAELALRGETSYWKSGSSSASTM